MPVTIAGENNAVTINQPTGVVIHEGKQYNVPLECVFVNGVELEFDQKGLDGCLLLIPRIVNNKMESPIGGAIYLSERVRNSLFAHLFLYGAESDYFKLVYTDQENTPLALYGGRLIGPLKIWEVSYPEGLQPSEWYYKRDELPDPDVRKI